jgi:hypothetical protein
MQRVHIFVRVSEKETVSAALEEATGEVWSLVCDPPAGGPFSAPPRYPGAAWASGQWEDETVQAIKDAVLAAASTGIVRDGEAAGIEVVGGTDPAQSMDDAYAEWKALNPD